MDTSLNRPNPVLAIKGKPNQRNNKNQARGRAFALVVAEASQDSNVMTGTFSLNDHFAIVLFDYGTDYNFISTNFLPLIDLKPSVISPGYEIKIASGLKVETNKIVRGCRLELEGHTFIIDLIPFGHVSFDVIVGMDWLSKLRAKIVCFEKIVKIPLSNGENLEVHKECPEGNLKQLKSMKVNEPKLKDIPVVRDFPGMFSEDLSSLLLSRKIAKPLTMLTQKVMKFEWGNEQENTFQTLKDMLCDSSIFALPEGPNDIVVYCDTSNQGFGCVLMQRSK
nr:putative reverse transcriptase domain-containing protein [Tanacetum cinerariifolium]